MPIFQVDNNPSKSQQIKSQSVATRYVPNFKGEKDSFEKSGDDSSPSSNKKALLALGGLAVLAALGFAFKGKIVKLFSRDEEHFENLTREAQHTTTESHEPVGASNEKTTESHEPAGASDQKKTEPEPVHSPAAAVRVEGPQNVPQTLPRFLKDADKPEDGQFIETKKDASGNIIEAKLCKLVDGGLGGQVKKEILVERYEYDSNGRIIKFTPAEVIDGEGKNFYGKICSQEYTYDSQGRICEVRSLVKKYISWDNIKSYFIVERYAYDNAGRVIQKDSHAEIPRRWRKPKQCNKTSQKFEYDTQGNVSRIKDNSSVTDFTYDSTTNRLTNAVKVTTQKDGSLLIEETHYESQDKYSKTTYKQSDSKSPKIRTSFETVEPCPQKAHFGIDRPYIHTRTEFYDDGITPRCKTVTLVNDYAAHDERFYNNYRKYSSEETKTFYREDGSISLHQEHLRDGKRKDTAYRQDGSIEYEALYDEFNRAMEPRLYQKIEYSPNGKRTKFININRDTGTAEITYYEDDGITVRKPTLQEWWNDIRNKELKHYSVRHAHP